MKYKHAIFRTRDICHQCYDSQKQELYVPPTKQKQQKQKCECVSICSRDELTELTASLDNRIHDILASSEYIKDSFSSKDIVEAFYDLGVHEMPKEKGTTIYTKQRISVLAIALARFICDKYEHDCDNSIFQGTKWKNYTNTDSSGTANPLNGGYLQMESYEELLSHCESNKEDIDSTQWKRVVEKNFIQPRSVDFTYIFVTEALPYIFEEAVSVYIAEAAYIINKLSNDVHFPWIVSSEKFTTTLLTPLAKKAPIMLGSYFQDLFKHELDFKSGIFTYDFDCKRHLDHKRAMLKYGYLKAVLEVKNVKDVYFQQVLVEGKDYLTVLVGDDCSVQGLSSKTVIHHMDAYEGAMEKLQKWPFMVSLLQTKKLTTEEALTGFACACGAAASATFLFTDNPIIAETAQQSSLGEDSFTYKPRRVDKMTGIPLEYYPDSGSVASQIIYDTFSKCVPRENLEEGYIQAQTTNSAGNVDFSAVSSSLPLNFKSILKTKVGYLAFNPSMITNLETYKSALSSSINALFRQQIWRRQRMVAGMNPAQQLEGYLMYSVMPQLGHLMPSFSPGKTTGSVKDQAHSLSGTGAPGVALEYLDVSGFDGAYRTDVQDFVVTSGLLPYKNYDDLSLMNGYFCVSGENRIVQTLSIEGDVLSEAEEWISSPQMVHLYTKNVIMPVKVKDPRDIQTSISTLPSGSYNTTAKGTMITASCVEAMTTQFPTAGVSGKASGDDFSMKYSLGSKPEERVTNVRDALKDAFARFGFKVESASSTVFCEFLQLGSFCGTLCSYAHRLSPYSAERLNNDQHHLSKLVSTFAIYHELMGRVLFPDALRVQMHRFAYTTRAIQVSQRSPDTTKQFINKKPWINVPFVGMLIRYSLPFPGVERYKHPPSANFCTGGSTKNLELFALMAGFRTSDTPYSSDWEDFIITTRSFKRREAKLGKELNVVEKRAFARTLLESGILFERWHRRMRLDLCDDFELKRAVIYGRLNLSVNTSSGSIPAIEKDLIREGANKLNILMNSDRLVRSKSAHAALQDVYNLKLPGSMIVSEQNRVKLESVLVQAQAKNMWWIMMDETIDTFFKSEWSKTWSQLGRELLFPYLDVIINSNTEHKVEDVTLRNIINKIPLIPGSTYSRNIRSSLFRGGVLTSNVDEDLARLDIDTRTSFMDNNIEEWRRIISLSSSMNDPNFDELIFDATGMSDRQKITFNKLKNADIISGAAMFHITSNAKERTWHSTDARSITDRNLLGGLRRLRTRPEMRTGMALATMLINAYGPHFGDSKLSITFPISWSNLVKLESSVMRRVYTQES